jgi:excisionase family DNA binding protein
MDMTTTEAAARLRIQPATVKQDIRRGLIAATKRGRDYFITTAELERFEANRRPVGWPKGRKKTTAPR